MIEKRKIGFCAPVPLRVLLGCDLNLIFLPLLLDKYIKDYDIILKEGEDLGFDLNSPLVSRIALPLVKREAVEKIIIVSPLDVREILTAFEVVDQVDYFVMKISMEMSYEIEKLLKFLNCSRRETFSLMDYSSSPPFSELDYFLNLFAPWSDSDKLDFTNDKPMVGLIGEFPPTLKFIEQLGSFFKIEFIEFLHLLLDETFWKDGSLLLSPVERIDWLNEVCLKKRLGGFIFLYYSLSSWQNYEIIYGRELKCPFLALEIKEGIGFEEREMIRLEAFKNTLKGG